MSFHIRMHSLATGKMYINGPRTFHRQDSVACHNSLEAKEKAKWYANHYKVAVAVEYADGKIKSLYQPEARVKVG